MTKFRSPNFCVEKFKTKAFRLLHIKGLLSLYSKGREYKTVVTADKTQLPGLALIENEYWISVVTVTISVIIVTA